MSGPHLTTMDNIKNTDSDFTSSLKSTNLNTPHVLNSSNPRNFQRFAYVCVRAPKYELTQNRESSRSRPHGSLDGLALKHSIICKLNPLYPQVVFSRTVISNYSVTRITWSTKQHIKKLCQKKLIELTSFKGVHALCD